MAAIQAKSQFPILFIVFFFFCFTTQICQDLNTIVKPA